MPALTPVKAPNDGCERPDPLSGRSAAPAVWSRSSGVCPPPPDSDWTTGRRLHCVLGRPGVNARCSPQR